MRWNNNKFQLLRIGPNNEIKDNIYVFSPDFDDDIVAKSAIKDMGIMVDCDLRYKEQCTRAV